MCCFSGEVDEVKGTRIFAGAQSNGRQWLAYEMSAAIGDPVAMVLPLPVPVDCADDAVRFVSFEHLPGFFDTLDTLFPQYLQLSRGGPADGDEDDAPAMLEVVKVGAFVASFVPSRLDFLRLDQRFRLPESFFDALPQLADFGFAVFQLGALEPRPRGLLEKMGLKRHPAPPVQDFHPMVFDFPRRDPGRLFFPTVHLHDGQVHPTAQFDHVLYAQAPGLVADGWEIGRPVGAEIAALISQSRGVLDAAHPIGKLELRGERTNADVWI